VSNRTLRKRITERLQESKEKSIQEIKRELIKRGLIRVGTSAPNDIIRKMYETMRMMMGEMRNMNMKTMYYNYINDEKPDAT
jgi:hypothetical protein